MPVIRRAVAAMWHSVAVPRPRLNLALSGSQAMSPAAAISVPVLRGTVIFEARERLECRPFSTRSAEIRCLPGRRLTASARVGMREKLLYLPSTKIRTRTPAAQPRTRSVTFATCPRTLTCVIVTGECRTVDACAVETTVTITTASATNPLRCVVDTRPHCNHVRDRSVSVSPRVSHRHSSGLGRTWAGARKRCARRSSSSPPPTA